MLGLLSDSRTAGRVLQHRPYRPAEHNPLQYVSRALVLVRGGKRQEQAMKKSIRSPADDAATSSSWSQRMALIQSLMGRVQNQLQAQSRLRPSNPSLAKELKAKAEKHLELLMKLAESEQQQHIAGSDSNNEELQQLLSDLQQQLDLEQEAAQTASSADAATDVGGDALQPAASGVSSIGLQQQLSQAEAEARALREQLEDVEARLQSTADELHEHRELQLAYDKQCQDMYRLRMQLQRAQSQGSDAASQAAQAARQHKQDLAWLMEAHRKEMHEANRKNQELITESQQLRMRVLEQEQLIWSLAGRSPAEVSSMPELATPDQEQQPDQQQQQQQPEQQPEQQQQDQAQLQLQQLQETTEQLVAEKQQLMKSLQDMQREQAVLLVELQQLRDAATAAATAATAEASSTEAALAAARAEGAAAAEREVIARLQETEQQRDSLIKQVQDLEGSLQEARDAATAATAVAAAGAQAAAFAASSAQPVPAVGSMDAAAAVAELKEAKLEMTKLRVQLADTRRELRQMSGRAETAEATLQQQAADFEARLAKLQSWYSKQSAVVAQLRKGKAPKDGQVGFTNTNKFWVPQALLFDFLKHWVSREVQLQQQEGFLGLQVQPGAALTSDGGVDVVVSSLWEDIPSWEGWSQSSAGTQQHLPVGVYQYVPPKGEGFPEAFVPFRDYDAAVNAKYK